MKVLHIIAAYKPAYIYGGPTMSASMLCEQLNQAGTAVEVFATTANGAGELPVTANLPVKVDGVTVTYFKRITKDHTHFSPALFNDLRKRAHEFDLIHIHAWWNLVSVFSAVIAQSKGIPLIISPRGTLSDYSFLNKNSGVKGLIHKLLGKKLLAKSHIHVTSKREEESIKKLVKPLSIISIPNFVKPGNTLIKKQPAGGLLKLLFFSRIEPKKGLDILLHALAFVTIPFHLTIAGDGDKEYTDALKALVTNPALSSKITWAGFYGDDKFDLLAAHHLLVLPSHDENFGNVVIESLSVGTAVLVSENVGLAGYVDKLKLGWVCQTNAPAVSNAINTIGAQLKQDLQTIRDTAPAIVRDDFTGNKLVQQYIQYYNNTITRA
ncbi:XrtY-associated glycosyltransferase XYAG1 [Mucilaginibacter phyllosphaerae]|uniref:Glycosyltransferase n=1 Tax=Mucilaginibacter phyllosphaerae TaxID=1812349 RepID=A0A4Y8AI26_9SPHI|nr:glycosyltransferase [Mucilaginibacter phyllosphaerae]MBB3968565.1 glycosyltransferase involved in cell wall biosynthesis [Mucilaginibacter phyllosphaerae]TEW67795.1 glycosyltransferase [Mucilaginibacter phyllosphaerae]GGH15200.1 LPS biosynthesis protein RfbU [Mucilaginibacter phyllosphaerae]